jgi:DNA-binding NarL/FixJ family response regulator
VQKWGVRSLKLLYVENDATLRSLFHNFLSASSQIEMVGAFGKSAEALNRRLVQAADVALIDYSLDQNDLNGVELGIAMRNLNEHIGIVIYSQFSLQSVIGRVPLAMRQGWSFIEKSAETDVADYLEILRQTTEGEGNWKDAMGAADDEREKQVSIYFALTPRQRSIMTLIAKGRATKDIANELNLSYAHVRKELSKAYEVLVPDLDESQDLKTSAVLKYLEIVSAA